MDIEKDRLYKIAEISEALHIPKSTLTRWARNGQIRARKAGANWVMTGEDIEYLVRNGTDPKRE